MIKFKGFTLVEVLVAIAIFAVLSAAGWRVFDQLIKTRERNQQHAAHLLQLQMAYNQMLRDIQQITPISGKLSDTDYPALVVKKDLLQFNRAGVIDPLQQGLDQFEFVEYGYDSEKKALIRYKSPYIYRQDIPIMQADVVLAPITDLRLEVLDPDVQESWPAQTVIEADAEKYILTKLPKGIAVNFKYYEQDYRWLFALNNSLSNLPQDNNIEQNPSSKDEGDSDADN